MERFKKLKFRIGLFLFIFLSLSIVTMTTSYAKDEVNQEQIGELGPVITEETTDIENEQQEETAVEKIETDIVGDENSNTENGSELIQEEINETVEDLLEEENVSDTMTGAVNTDIETFAQSIIPMSVSGAKPKIEFNLVGITPKNPMVGQDFTVEYELVPHPFQHNVSNPKEIVLVLDKSGSMKDNNKMTNLKRAAKNFINKLTAVREGTTTPLITNLKISIVVYDKNGHIQQDLLQVTDLEKVNTKNVDKLLNTINNLESKGGTNTGDGLRKGAYVLDKGDSKANKTIILMSDGLPTYYTYEYKWSGLWGKEVFYTDLNNNSGRIGGNGSSDSNGNCLDYAKTIGAIIKSKNYNVYSIGYGLGNGNTEANKKLKQIHESMGGVSSGENSTFFATDSGAIDSVFESIADQLQKSYAFNDVQFNFNLANSFTFVSESINGVFKFDPIVYNLGEGNWYQAEKQTVEFTVRASQEGQLNLFSTNPTVSYTDIYGQAQSVLIPNQSINVTSYSTDELKIDLGSDSKGYLIGDTLVSRITATHPGSKTEKFTDVIYNFTEIPANFELEKIDLNFGTVSQTTTQNVNIKINNDDEVTVDNEKRYTLKGVYQYNVTKYQITTSYKADNVLEVPVRRGQIKVKVVDENNQDVTQLSTISLKNSNFSTNYENGYLVFDTVPSGNYEIVLESVADGLEIDENNKNAIVRLSYNQNIAEYIFQVQGSYKEEQYPEILAYLQSDQTIQAVNNQEIDITYTIDAKPFNAPAENGVNQPITEAVILLDASQSMYTYGLWGNVKENILSEIINHPNLQSLKLAVLPFGNNTLAFPNWTNQNYEQLFELKNGQNKEILNSLFKDHLHGSNQPIRNIDKALQVADQLLVTSGEISSNQSIIIISNDNMEISEEAQRLIREKHYNIISLKLANETTRGISLHEIHNRLGGEKNNYFELDPVSDLGNVGKKTIIEELGIIRNILLGNSQDGNSVISFSPTLNFDLGFDLSVVDNLVSSDETTYKITIPEVKYYPKVKNDDGTYQYQAAPFDVSFKIKVNTEKVGEITFANTDNVELTNITYTDFKDKEVKKLIETPVIEVLDIPEIIYDNHAINILEIQPADSFTLTGLSVLNKIKTGTESFTLTVDNSEYPVRITHMSMPEFIGKSEKIDGKYDVIVLGRYVDLSITSSSDELNQYRYRDYYYDRGNNNEENDITMRKANELIEFMNKNQLVYIDSNIIKNRSNSNYDYVNTNLNQVFSNITNTSQKNVKKDLITSKERNERSVTLETIIRDYISLDTKEKGFNLTAIDRVPNDVTTSDMKAVDGKASNRNRYLDLTIQNADQSRENITLNLYLDLNGDGLYSEDEIVVKRTQLSLPLENYQLDFSVHPDFIGLLEWKLEVIREGVNDTKTYLTGSNFFHRLTEEKKKINVLQITASDNYENVDGQGNTNDNKEYQILNLKENDKFKQLLATPALKDYNITIDIIHYKDHIKYLNVSDDKLTEDELRIKYLNGYYDMVITGFRDVYGRNAFSGERNKLVDLLIEFVQTGQGVMLTHDTIEKNDTPSMFTTFRVYAGQSRYPTTLNGQLVSDFDGTAINYDTNIRGNNINGLATWGLMNDSDGARNSMSTYVYQTNNALITSYPYKLIDEETNGLLRIRRTHGQYYQLNLEDEEIIPWYTLSANNVGENGGRQGYFNTWINSINPYDIRNNYYTYSKGNITFSGTGEQRREYIHYPDSELKLFVNTIIKAERGANHRPTVEVQNLEDYQQVAKAQSKIEFNVIPRDIDLDSMDVTVEVMACRNNSCQTSLGDSIVFKDKRDHESFKVTLDQHTLSRYEEIAKGNYTQLQVKVYAVDEHGAKSEEIVKILDIVDVDLLSVGLSTMNQLTTFLVGDSVELLATFEKEQSYQDSYMDLSYTLKSLPSYLILNGDLTQNLGNLNALLASASYQLKIGSSNQFLVSDPTRVTISGDSRYCINNCSQMIEGTQSLDLSIKKGQVRLKLISEEFNDLLQQITIKVRHQNGTEYNMTPNNAGEFILDNVPTGTYSLTVKVPEELQDFDVIQKNGDHLETVDLTQGVVFDIDYENNVFEVNYEFFEPQTEVLHGLYGGINSDKTAVTIIESLGESAHTFIGKTNINFAGMFTYKSPLQEVILEVNSAFNLATQDIKVYQVMEEQDGIRLVSVENVGIHLSKQNNRDQIRFSLASKVPTNSKVLILYDALAPDIDSVFINRLSVGVASQPVEIKAIKQIDKEGISTLPNLF